MHMIPCGCGCDGMKMKRKDKKRKEKKVESCQAERKTDMKRERVTTLVLNGIII